MTTRAARRSRARTDAANRQAAQRIARLDAILEYRVRRGWLVRLAAYTRQWALVRAAARFVRIDARPVGARGWVELDVRPSIAPNGALTLTPVRGAE